MKKSLLVLSIGLALNSVGASAAVLQTGDRLSIESGSYYDLGGLGFKSALFGFNGITVGPAPGDTGTGSHGGSPLPTDVGAVTRLWLFKSNSGYDYLSDTTGSGSFGGDTASGVDMSTWTVTWNGIPAIPMGGCSLGDPANNGGFSTCDKDKDGVDDFIDTGIGTFNWSGIYGDVYTITYASHVPLGDPSGFGGVQYDLFLTGTVSAVPVPAAVWLFGSGLLGLVGLARRKK